MKRRYFTKIVSLSTVAITTLPSYISCTSEKKEPLQNLIGKTKRAVRQFSVIGTEEFSYVNLKGDEFETEFKTKLVVVYLENQKIVGYTLAIDTDIIEKLKHKYGEPKLEIKNYFGEKWIWQTNNLVRSLTVVKPNSLFLYSCYLPNTKLIVF